MTKIAIKIVCWYWENYMFAMFNAVSIEKDQYNIYIMFDMSWNIILCC